MATTLRLGDPDNHPLEALEIAVKTSKCTALARPKSWNRFAPRESKPTNAMDVDPAPAEDDDGDEVEAAKRIVWAQLRMRTEFYVRHDDQDEDEGNEDIIGVDGVRETGAKVEKEQLVRGFKYGSSYVPCPDGQFAKLKTHKGISICGFFNADNV
jgi:ATP-dependent DNA helicase 2 subunit 2